jgi:hypothetical protein
VAPLAVVPAEPTGWRERAALVGRAIWARKWKLLRVIFLYGLGRSCAFWPHWAAPLCELLWRLGKELPG